MDCACSGLRRCVRSPRTRSDRCARLSRASRPKSVSCRRLGGSARAPATHRRSERAALTRKPPRLLVTTPESLTLMLTQERARDTFASLVVRCRRRMARAYGQQAGRADAACARAPSSFLPGPCNLGPLGDARQSRRGEARASRSSRRAARSARRGAARQAAGHRHASAEVARTLSLGGSPWRENGRAGRRRDRSRGDDARLHQHALSGGALVSAHSSPAAGMGRESSRSITARCRARRATGWSRG